MKDDNRDLKSQRELAHREYMELQRQEMLGEVNRYFASLRLKRPPSDSEAVMHYIQNGGAKSFFERYGHIICPLENPN